MKSYVKLWSVPVLFCFERKTRNLTPRNLILLSRVVWCGSTKQLESFLWDKSLLQSEGFNFSMAAHLLTQITAAVAPKLNGLGLPPYVQTKTHPSQRTQPTHFLICCQSWHHSLKSQSTTNSPQMLSYSLSCLLCIPTNILNLPLPVRQSQ